MKGLFFLLMCLLMLVFSCQTGPGPESVVSEPIPAAPAVEETPPPVVPEPVPAVVVEEPVVEEPEPVVEPEPEPIIEPEPEPEAIVEPEPEPVIEPEPVVEPEPEEEYFDPNSVPQEVFDSTKTDVQELINSLNGIISSKNYDGWTTYLGREYMARLSSPEELQKASGSARLTAQKIVLTSLRDYFIYVVVPSRANARVDDIEFVSPTRVRAFSVNRRGERLSLYDLEKTGNSWKIIN